MQADAIARAYQFNTNIAKHYFCRHCGIHTFHRPRSTPELYSVNLRCLDDFDPTTLGIEQRRFDGKNWEQAVASAQALTAQQLFRLEDAT